MNNCVFLQKKRQREIRKRQIKHIFQLTCVSYKSAIRGSRSWIQIRERGDSWGCGQAECGVGAPFNTTNYAMH